MNLVIKIVLFFLIAQLIGLYTGVVVLNDLTRNPYVSPFIIPADKAGMENALWLFAYIVLGAIIMVVLIRKFFAHKILFVLLEYFLIAVSSSIVFYSFLRLGFDYGVSVAVGIILALALAAIKFVFPSFKNIAAILATAGVGAVFGASFSPSVIIAFIILLAIYDYVAVFITQHMVDFANFVVKRDMAFTISAKGLVEGKEKRIDIGSGDFTVPITLEVALFSFNPQAALVVLAGALVAVSVFLYFVWKKHVVLPALPPISLGMFAALLLGLLTGIC